MSLQSEMDLFLKWESCLLPLHPEYGVIDYQWSLLLVDSHSNKEAISTQTVGGVGYARLANVLFGFNSDTSPTYTVQHHTCRY